MLVHRARDRSTRLLDFFVATPGLGLRDARSGEMHAVDVGFGDSETKQVSGSARASCAVPGAAAGLEAVAPCIRQPPVERALAPAVALARTGVELTKPQAYLHAILDPILRHTEEGRRVYGAAGRGSRAGDVLRLPDLADMLEAVRPGRSVRYLPRRAGARDRGDRSCGRRRHHPRRPRVVPRRRGDGRFAGRYHGHECVSNPPPSSGGILIAYGLALLERARL